MDQDLLFGVNPSCRTGDALIGVRKALHGDLHFVNGLKGPVSLPKYVFFAQILPYQTLPNNATSLPRLLSQRYSGLDHFDEGSAPSKSTGLSAGAIVGIIMGSLAAALALAYGLLLVGRHANAQQVSDKLPRKELGCTLGQRGIPILIEGLSLLHHCSCSIKSGSDHVIMVNREQSVPPTPAAKVGQPCRCSLCQQVCSDD